MPGDGVPAIDLQDVASLPTVALGIPALLMVESLARALRDCDLHVVGCHVRLAALLEKVRRCRPDIVIVDAGMAALPLGAPKYLAQLAGAGAGSRFVVLADDVDRALARAVIDHGVQAVILKSTPVADAVGVLRHVAHGRTSFPAAVLDRIGDRPDEQGLSARQLEVLEELALGRSNREIAGRLFISTNTVKLHLRAIYERLGVSNRVEAARLPGDCSKA